MAIIGNHTLVARCVLRRRTFAVAAALCLAATRAPGAGLTIRADPTSVEVGEPVSLVLALEGANARARPVLAFPKGVKATPYRHKTVFRQDARGLYQALEFPYDLKFQAPGSHKIGPATIQSSRLSRRRKSPISRSEVWSP